MIVIITLALLLVMKGLKFFSLPDFLDPIRGVYDERYRQAID